MERIKNYRMTYRILRNYLLSQPKGSIVGVSGNDCKCPVAEAYKRMLRGREKGMLISVGQISTDIYRTPYFRSLHITNPKFVQRFIGMIDGGTEEADVEITREKALEMLEACYGTRNIYRGDA